MIFALMVRSKTEMQITLRQSLTDEEYNEILSGVTQDHVIKEMAIISLTYINSIGPNREDYWYAVTKASSVILYELGFEGYNTLAGHLKFYRRVEMTKAFNFF